MMLYPLRKLIDAVITSLLWGYFIFGFAIFFAPRVVSIMFIAKSGETGFQKLLHRFFQFFFRLTQTLSPGLRIEIDPRITTIRSSIIVANHQSYLDPLLFVSLFEKQKTIVKNTFFKVPLFRQFLIKSGYIPSAANGKQMAMVLRHLGSMKEYLASGGILFIFPEGTRSKDGQVNTFNKGAFNIARQCQAPVCVVHIHNTNRLFKPGNWLLNTCQQNTIKLELLKTYDPPDSKSPSAIEEMAADAKQTIENQINRNRKSV